MVNVRVSRFSTINVASSTYSVPSRLIGLGIRDYIYPTEINLYYGNSCVYKMPKLPPKSISINYRHIISHLIRKPGAFANYQYQEHLFPRSVFRKAYDALIKVSPSCGHIDYIKVLHLAAITNEGEVCAAIEILLESNELPSFKAVKDLLDLKIGSMPKVEVNRADLKQYDQLIQEPGLLEVHNAIIH